MTKEEFIKKYAQYIMVSHKGWERYNSDLQSVIQNNLEKFKEWINTNDEANGFIMDWDLENYLNKKP